MPTIQILYWRDIPAQVIAKAGRKSAKKQLAERFEKAIDMAAMRSGASGTDDYLSDWRRGDPQPIEGDLETAVDNLARDLEATYDDAYLKALIGQGGHEADASSTG